MSKNLSPLRYPGSKNKLYKYIKHLIEVNNSTTYIEPFVGGGSVAIKLLLNTDVKIIINDYDKSIYAFWHSVLNHTDDLITLIKTTDITIENWHKYKSINKLINNNLLELGFSTLFLNRTNRSGILKAGVMGGLNQSGNYKIDCRFNKDAIINKIKEIAKHKDRIKLYNKDAETFIKENITHITTNSLIFFDPPYYNKGKSLYNMFYNNNEHQNLSNTIQTYLTKHNYIITYDVVDEISKIYNKLRNVQYYLNYSINKPTKGVEYMFFSNTIKIGDINNYLNIKLT